MTETNEKRTYMIYIVFSSFLLQKHQSTFSIFFQFCHPPWTLKWRIARFLNSKKTKPTPWSPTLRNPVFRLPGHSWEDEANCDLRRQRLQSPLPSSAAHFQFVQWKGKPFPFWEGWRGWGQEQRLLREGGVMLLSRRICGGGNAKHTLFVWGRGEICSEGASYTFLRCILVLFPM